MIPSFLNANCGEIALRSILPELVSGRGTARRSRVVEGQACARCVDYTLGASVGIAQDLSGGNPQRRDPSLGKEGIAFRIALRPVAHVVRDTIDLDPQPCIAAIKVEDEIVTAVLATKLEAIGAGLKHAPQQNFGQRHFPAQLARFANGSGGRFWRNIFQHRKNPSTMLRMVPLPETSSGRI